MKHKTPVMERRTATLDRRSVADGNSRQFEGHAAVFNQRAAIGNPLRWGFYEQIAPSAFTKTISDRADVVMLADHDPGKPLARVSADTLRLSTDMTGLLTNSDLVETSYADDLIANVRAGNVKGMSFGFETLKDDWQTEDVETTDGQSVEVDVRTLLEVRLIEVSTTAFPAYDGTDAGLRSLWAAYDSRALRHGTPLPRPTIDACTAIGVEVRAGATLSSDTLKTLQQVLDLIAAADDNVDAAQPLLAALMGVPNPDAADEENSSTDAKAIEDIHRLARLRLLAARYNLT